MVASTKIFDKSIHPQEGSNKQKEPFFILFACIAHKIGHNSAVNGRTEIWLRPPCSSRDSAPDEISVIEYFKKVADREMEAKLDLAEKHTVLFIAS